MYTLKGLDVCGALIPPILHHTWILANIFKPLSEDYIEKYYSSIKKIILYDKLKTVFNDNNKAIRLTNIFFKAVNICYNNKSNFSINIIDKTKKSFETSYIDNYTDLLEAYKSYYNIKNIYNSDNPIFNNEYKLYTEEDLYNVKISFNNIVATTTDINIKTKKNNINDNLGELHGYFYAVEKLEAKICDKGMIFNSKIGECEKIPDTDKNKDNDKDKKDDIKDDIDSFDMSELKKIFNMFLQIILVIIILYIIYIFYDIFGEIIFTVFNYLYMKFYEIYKNTSFYINSYFIVDNEDYEKQKIDTDYKLANIEYENLQNNHLKILSYMNENKIPINPDY